MNPIIRGIIASLCLLTYFSANLRADSPQSGVDFFESKIRPVLVEHCYSCHNSADTREAGLSVDYRTALIEGGDGGSVVTPGDPTKSRLISVIKHEIDGLEMPEGGPKLDDDVVADFERWIKMGAPDPRDAPPSASEVADAVSWESTLRRRKQWWSLQPIEPIVPPSGDGHPIDRFVEAKLAEAELAVSPLSKPETLIRRLFFALLGLPPTPEQIQHWQDRYRLGDQQVITEQLIDELLDSPHFGERWARHWMDWIRYAESHGSEGDPAIAGAWLYRDYLIRALNDDVPVDQLIREHVAGDLLESPRVNEELGINESIIGPAHWRMVFHGFAPTDALDEKVRFVDDQINAFSKAFLGLTVSCARCHDHKFDAISQADYYALFGILAACRPARHVIDLPDTRRHQLASLAALKPRIRSAIASDWLESLTSLPDRLTEKKINSKSAGKVDSILNPLHQLQHQTEPDAIAAAWEQLVESHVSFPDDSPQTLSRWDFSQPADYARWYRSGKGLASEPSAPGEFAIAPSGDTALTGLYPAGVYSHTLSKTESARLSSPDFTVKGESEVWIRAIGDAGSMVRYVVQDYPRKGTVYPVRNLKPTWDWQRLDLSYWEGDSAHIELTTGKDAPLLVGNDERSWFGVSEVRVTRKGQPGPKPSPRFLPALKKVVSDPPRSQAEVIEIYVSAIANAIRDWDAGSVTNAQALLLDGCLQEELLANRIDSLSNAVPLIDEYRQLESKLPIPTRVPGLDETVGRAQPLYVRGNHKQPADIVAPRFLEAIDPSDYHRDKNARQQLADDLLAGDNPLTRRVMVNRVWHHLFGRGIVNTPDNLGRLGGKPSHPELLDWLALRFEQEGWSLKRLVRLLVTSHAWQRSSQPSAAAKKQDPDNRLLSHAHLRRLEAEAIRDSLLAVSGQLHPEMFGPPVIGTSNRRSIYVRVIRNNLDPLLRVFDFPEPFSATGRRDATNVPAQSLTLMNDPQIATYAATLATAMLADSAHPTDEKRLSRLYLTLLGRQASPDEISMGQDFLASSRRLINQQSSERLDLRQEIDRKTSKINATLAPAKEKLEKETETRPELQTVFQPIAHWEFDHDLEDRIGNNHGIAHAGARVENGALVLSPGSYVTTSPLQHELTEKTLEAWVQLDQLKQRGGGVITVQSKNGVMFDSIVFGEAEPRRWLAGSNNFRRTKSFQGPTEQHAVERPVHVAIAYHDDGQIIAYRDGKRYGKAYRSDGPFRFRPDETIISFGVRHLPATGNRMLGGRIERAKVYDRALSDEQIAASFAGSDHVITDAQILEALSTQDRKTVESLRHEVDVLQERLDALGPSKAESPHQAAWTELVQAMLTLQEFIYVR